MELTRAQQQHVLDALAQVISRRYSDVSIKFTLTPEAKESEVA